MILLPQTWHFEEIEISFSSHLLSSPSYNCFWLRLWALFSGGGLRSHYTAPEELSSARGLQNDPAICSLSSWLIGGWEMVWAAGRLLRESPSRDLRPHVPLCWADRKSHRPASWASLCSPFPWDTLVLLWPCDPLSHSLTCRKVLSSFVGLGRLRWLRSGRVMGRGNPEPGRERGCSWTGTGHP